MDWVETAILRPEYVVMWLHLGFNYNDLEWGETWPGLRWGVNIGTWVDVARVKVDANICNLDGAWMDVTQEYWDLNAGDAGSGWRWDTNFWTWIAPRWDLDGLKFNLQDLDGVEMWPGLSWDAHLETWIGWYGTRSWHTIHQLRRTWMKVRHTSWNLYGFEIMLRWN